MCVAQSTGEMFARDPLDNARLHCGCSVSNKIIIECLQPPIVGLHNLATTYARPHCATSLGSEKAASPTWSACWKVRGARRPIALSITHRRRAGISLKSTPNYNCFHCSHARAPCVNTRVANLLEHLFSFSAIGADISLINPSVASATAWADL